MPAEPMNPTKVAELWSEGLRHTAAERRQAAINRSFIRNRQWVTWNEGANRLEEAPRADRRVRATVPRIGPDSRRLLAKLMRRGLVFEVHPDAADDATTRAARLGEAVLADAHGRLSWERVRSDHAWAAWESGVGLLCVEWDPTVGSVIGEAKGRTLRTGDVKVSALGVHEVATEPGAASIEEAGWWVRGQALPPEQVQRRYNLEKKPPATANHVDGVWHLGNERATPVPLTMVLTYYRRPYGPEDQGEVMVVVDSQVVEHGPWYFPNPDRLNVTSAVVQPLHGTWLGHTPVSDAVPVQAAYNASWSSIIEHMRNAGTARLWVPMGAVEDVEELSDTPGEAVEYNPINNLRPGYESPPAMPDWWIRQPDMLAGSLDDILSVHDVSRGEAPTGVESGVALSVLAEADDTPIGAFANELGECWARAGRLVLGLYEARATETRTAVVKQDRVPERVQWIGADLMGQHNVVVPRDSVMPRSRAAQAAYALQLYDRKILTTPEQLAKIADLPDQDDMLEGLDPDTARARRENLAMAVGTARTVDQIDEHANHIRVHRDFLKSERFEQLPPDVQGIFVDHLRAHEFYAAQQAAQQVQAAQLGGPVAAAVPTVATQPIDPAMLGAGMPMSGGEPAPGEEPMPEDMGDEPEPDDDEEIPQ